MSNKKEEERNEKIIRGLMKLPPNRRCINCNSLGPQYVCTNFWTFVCITCSGIHREFTHRVKSVSMAKFTTQEVDALQKGGNQRARELFLTDWDTQRMRLPDNSNPDKIREFIKSVYVEKKYAGGRSSDKPPRDTQTNKGAEDHRRASSYHSFSQSPPYDQQYEERRYGRQAGMLTRKPGSDRGHYEGKFSNFMYSPGRQVEQMYEDRFANESSGSRLSDYSVSSIGDPFKFGSQSPNFHDSGYSSPAAQVREILAEDVQPQKVNTSTESYVKENHNRIPCSHRSTSAGSFGSLDSNSTSRKSANSGSLMDSVLEPEHASEIHLAEALMFPSSDMPFVAQNTNVDLFSQAFIRSQNSSSAASIDLFCDFSHQPSIVAAKEQHTPAAPFSANQGWATFDLPQHSVQPFEAKPMNTHSPFETNQELPPMPFFEKGAAKGDADLFSSMKNNSDWFPVQHLSTHGSALVMNDQNSVGLNELKVSADSSNFQLWNDFDDSTRKIAQTPSGILSQNSESYDLLHRPPTSLNPYSGFKDPETTFNSVYLSPAVCEKDPAVATAADMPISTFSQSAMPQMGGTVQEKELKNPFDLLFDSNLEPMNMFLDMSSLQTALPHQQLPSTFDSGSSESWFPQNLPSNFIPTVPQDVLSYIEGKVHSSQLQNMQEPVSSLGGNPFA